MDLFSYSAQGAGSSGGNDDVSYAAYYAGDSLVYNDDWPGVFAVYLGYFAGLCVFAALLDGSQIFDKFVSKLGLTAYHGFESYDRLDRARQESAERGSANFDSEKKLAEIRNEVVSEDLGEGKDQNRCWKKFIKYVFCHLPSEPFSFEFFEALLNTDNYFFGCEDICHKGGLVLECFCWKNIYTFPVGMMEDFYFYVCNNHSMFSMVLATRGNPFSRAKRRLAFFGQNCFALFCQVFLKLITENKTEILAINIFILSPLVILFNRIFYYLLVCPCFLKIQRSKYTKGCFSFIVATGMLLSIPVTLLTICMLLFCAVYSGRRFAVAAKTISNYAWSIHIIAAIQELMWCMLMFLGGRQGTSIRCSCCELISFGSWYSKKVEKLFLVKDKDFIEKEWKYGFLTWTVQIEEALYQKTLKMAEDAQRNISTDIASLSKKFKKPKNGRTMEENAEVGESEVATDNAGVTVSVEENRNVNNPINVV